LQGLEEALTCTTKPQQPDTKPRTEVIALPCVLAVPNNQELVTKIEDLILSLCHLDHKHLVASYGTLRQSFLPCTQEQTNILASSTSSSTTTTINTSQQKASGPLQPHKSTAAAAVTPPGNNSDSKQGFNTANLLSALPGKGLLFSPSSSPASAGAGADACRSGTDSGDSSSSFLKALGACTNTSKKCNQAGQQRSSRDDGNVATSGSRTNTSNLPALMTERKAVSMVLAGLLEALSCMRGSNVVPSTIFPSQIWVASCGTVQLLPLLHSLLQPGDAAKAGLLGSSATAEELQYMAPETLALLISYQQQQQHGTGSLDSRAAVGRLQLPLAGDAPEGNEGGEMVCPEKVRESGSRETIEC
jgi:hypothetical protein